MEAAQATLLDRVAWRGVAGEEEASTIGPGLLWASCNPNFGFEIHTNSFFIADGHGRPPTSTWFQLDHV